MILKLLCNFLLLEQLYRLSIFCLQVLTLWIESVIFSIWSHKGALTFRNWYVSLCDGSFTCSYFVKISNFYWSKSHSKNVNISFFIGCRDNDRILDPERKFVPFIQSKLDWNYCEEMPCVKKVEKENSCQIVVIDNWKLCQTRLRYFSRLSMWSIY